MSENQIGQNNPSWKGDRILLCCESCGVPFTVDPCRKNKARFCSTKCVSEWMAKTFVGKKSFNWKPRKTRKCKYCGKAFQVSPFMPHNRFCNRKCYFAWSRSLKHNHWNYKDKIELTCIGCRKKFRVYPYEKNNKKWRRTYCSKKCYLTHVIKPTGPEKRFIRLCEKNSLPFKYVGDGSFWIGSLNPDFIHNDGQKILIEIFGKYWHQDKGNIPQRQTYKGRKEYFYRHGWQCEIFWEEEVKKELVLRRLRNCIDRIQGEILPRIQ